MYAPEDGLQLERQGSLQSGIKQGQTPQTADQHIRAKEPLEPASIARQPVVA